MQDGKKHRLSQLMVNELLDDIDSQFKDMSVLQKEGKKQEAEVMWADLKCMLSNYRHDFSFEKNDMRILLKPVFLHRAVYWLKMRRLYSEHFLIGIMMITWV